jgi:threonine synthase
LTALLGPLSPEAASHSHGHPNEPAAAASPRWRVPDWYFQSVSGGIGPLGVQKGFEELRLMNLADRVPAMANIQAEGCAPMVHAWKAGRETAEAVRSPRTHIATLATGDPGRTYTLLYRRMLQGGGGCFEAVTDEETYRTMHILAKMEGISVEPAAAVAFAGLIKMVRSGQVKPSDVVVVNCTGHTMPIENLILGEGWARNLVLPIERSDGAPSAAQSEQARSETPEEGLLAALDRVTADRFSSVVIVDDNPDSRRLIRRILQSQSNSVAGSYKLFEASDGYEAIQLAQQEQPDLIILDLMMPDLDGFAVLDALKANPQTASIPVIVVTAKELTLAENERLRGQIHSLMQKGEFMNDDLLEEVRTLLR